MGSVDRPFNPVSFALGCNSTYVARTMDVDTRSTWLKTFECRLRSTSGTSFIEIMQNCVIFNKDFYDDFADKGIRDDKTIDLRPGQPLVYGKEGDKGVAFDGWDPKLVSAGDAHVWDPSTHTAAPAFTLSTLDENPDMPVPIGIFRSIDAPVFDEDATRQVQNAVEQKGRGKLRDLVYAGDMWTVD